MAPRKKPAFLLLGIIGLVFLISLLRKTFIKAQTIAYTGPIVISAKNYTDNLPEMYDLGSFYVYGRYLGDYEQAVAELSQIASDPNAVNVIKKILSFTSYQDLNSVLSQHAGDLQGMGVTTLGYNTEGGLTPPEEMDNLADSVVQFVTIASQYGFDTSWGAIRVTMDQISDEALESFFQAGLDGFGLQEQKFISGEQDPPFSGCVPDRQAAAEETVSRYRSLASLYNQTLTANTQIMATRCVVGDTYAQTNCGAEIAFEYQHCDEFTDTLQNSVDSIGIWASGGEDLTRLVGLIETLRAGGIQKSSDINHDGVVNNLDFLILLNSWGSIDPEAPEDLDSNGVVNSLDALQVFLDWT